MAKKPPSDIDDKLARVLEYQRALTGFSRVAGESMVPDRLMQHAAAQVSALTHVGRVKVMRYRPDRGDLLVEAGVGWKSGVVGHATLGIDQASPPGRALQTGMAVTIEDLPNDPEFRVSDLLADHQIVSVINVPILLDGQTWGILEADASTPRSFDETDVAFLTIVANILGAALKRCELESKVVDARAECTRTKTEQEVVLAELQHRVKNNFQVILSFLALQRRDATPENSQERFTSTMDRVHAIALAHDQLTHRDAGGSVEFGDYLRALCANINPYRESVRIHVEADPTAMPLDRAVPAGLIVNELVTNSLKYAFGGEGGAINVTFCADRATGEACITVEDDGHGMSAQSGKGQSGHGLGTKLVHAFINQLHGRIERVEIPRGTKVRAYFPIPM
jgi:two-component sensor histidine kinase